MAKRILSLVLAALLACPAVAATQQRIPEQQVVRQESPYGCGPAAVAELMNVFYSARTSEQEIAALAGGEQSGATLLGLKKAAVAKGYSAVGYRLTVPQVLASIESLGAPILVHLRPAHFMLALGRVHDKVLLLDPTHGKALLNLTDFERQFSGHVLVIASTPSAGAGQVLKDLRRSKETRLTALNHAGALGGGGTVTPRMALRDAPFSAIPLTDADMAPIRGDGFLVVLAATWATIGAVLALAQLWEMYHRGEGHVAAYSDLHFWYGVPYVHLHHP